MAGHPLRVSATGSAAAYLAERGLELTEPADAAFVVGHDVDAPVDIERLWLDRLKPFVDNLEHGRFTTIGGPRLSPSDPQWPVVADRLLARLAHHTRYLPRSAEFAWDHIGSTSVPGLAAKPIVDLQLGVPSLDHIDGIDEAVHTAGFVDVAKVVPNSPGVLRDQVRGPGNRWDKRLFSSADPGQPAILHVRQLDSPWWSYTVKFRDLLRADDTLRAEYERIKRGLTEIHGEKSDYDSYTIAKTAFFDRIQHRIG